MFDAATPRGRILAAALTCAGAKSWADVTLVDIAEAAELSLADLRQHFDSKIAILSAIMSAIDDEVLRTVPKRVETQDARDVLFDVIMTRFDALATYKTALKSIYQSSSADPSMMRPMLTSMHWMLQAAGIDTESHIGRVRMMGLATVYASVFRIWLDDDDAGHARTMAALDRRLRRGESVLRSVEHTGAVLHRLSTDGPAFLRSFFRNRKPEPQAPPRPGEGLT